MKNTNFAESHLLADEVDVDLNVLGTAVVNRVGSHVDGADIVAVDHGSYLQRDMEFLKELAQPTTFGDHMSNSPVLGLRTGPGHRGLPFGRPRHQDISEEDVEA